MSDKSHLSAPVTLPWFICIHRHAFTISRTLTETPSQLRSSGVDHLTGFKMGDWDQIFSVWQPGQYRPPVIKPLPVKHPARIDEFPLGRAELSLELPAEEGGILSTEQVLARSTWSESYSSLCYTRGFTGFNGMEAGYRRSL